MDLHNGLDIEVYDLRPADLHYYYYCYLVASPASGHVDTCPPLAFERFFFARLYVRVRSAGNITRNLR